MEVTLGLGLGSGLGVAFFSRLRVLTLTLTLALTVVDFGEEALGLLPSISPTSPLDLAYVSPPSRLHLPSISPTSPLYLPFTVVDLGEEALRRVRVIGCGLGFGLGFGLGLGFGFGLLCSAIYLGLLLGRGILGQTEGVEQVEGHLGRVRG